MDRTVIQQISRLQRMHVAELRREWEGIHGEPPRSNNRTWLWRRLAWKIQAEAHGGLSVNTHRRIDALVPDLFTAPRGPREAATAPSSPESRPARDPRVPVPGTVLSKTYRGRELRVVLRDDGVEFDGTMYSSLTALAKTLTGCKSINGRLFFGLATRSRKR